MTGVFRLETGVIEATYLEGKLDIKYRNYRTGLFEEFHLTPKVLKCIREYEDATGVRKVSSDLVPPHLAQEKTFLLQLVRDLTPTDHAALERRLLHGF